MQAKRRSSERWMSAFESRKRRTFLDFRGKQDFLVGGKPCDQKLARNPGGKHKDGGAIGLQSSIDRDAVLNFSRTATKSTHDGFGGIVIERDPANHDVLRKTPAETAAGWRHCNRVGISSQSISAS